MEAEIKGRGENRTTLVAATVPLSQRKIEEKGKDERRNRISNNAG